MVKRTYLHSIKMYMYISFVLLVLVSCWETNKTNAALVEAGIPQESIRLRILANSDAPDDQWVKRKVRDAVTRQMNEWVGGPSTIEDARNVIHTHMRELEQQVGSVLQQYGYDYDYRVELGRVPFPTKMYGDKVYPAGEYEALRVTLGKGEGKNWWCVLFPPLCFVDAASGDAVDQKTASSETGKAGSKPEGRKVTVSDKGGSQDDRIVSTQAQVKQNAGTNEVTNQLSKNTEPEQHKPSDKAEVRFFLWDLIVEFFRWLRSLF